jgi:small subunit ribosomal protein S4
MRLLECRLDNVVYRLGLADSRAQARQIVSHGLVKVNGKKVNIPSFQIKENYTIEPKVKENYKDLDKLNVVGWLELDLKKTVGTVKHVPSREEIDVPVNESLIVEYYTR